MSRDDLERLNHLHREIRKEALSFDRRDERLWDFVERLAQEVLILRAQVEGWQLADVLDSGQESREVECEERFLFESNKVEILRKDTGEVVEIRPMEAQDRQWPMFSNVSSKPANKKYCCDSWKPPPALRLLIIG